jgi:acyl-CoA reductase-like NAD-dependent aldehyde dehydrogenase
VLVGRVTWAGQHEVDAALHAAQQGAKEMASWPLHRRF